MITLIMCLALLQGHTVKDRPESLAVCVAVGEGAEARGISPALPIALAYHESTLTWSAVSRVGALGPMQVMPRYIRCDGSRQCLVSAGLDMFEYWKGRYPNPVDTIAHYNGGNKPGKRSYSWARAVVRLSRKIGGK